MSSSFADDKEYQKGSYLSLSNLMSSTFINHSQTAKNLSSELFLEVIH